MYVILRYGTLQHCMFLVENTRFKSANFVHVFNVRIVDIITSLKKSSIVWQEVFDDKAEVRTVQTLLSLQWRLRGRAVCCASQRTWLWALAAAFRVHASVLGQTDRGGTEGLVVRCYRQIQGEESFLSYAPLVILPDSQTVPVQWSDRTKTHSRQYAEGTEGDSRQKLISVHHIHILSRTNF